MVTASHCVGLTLPGMLNRPSNTPGIGIKAAHTAMVSSSADALAKLLVLLIVHSFAPLGRRVHTRHLYRKVLKPSVACCTMRFPRNSLDLK